ncbi:MAG TPA: nucleotidyltransferase domain-containing protein [Thermoanaerobaculia bacterium]
MSRQEVLDRLCHQHGILAVYLFGSRADDGLRVLRGEAVSREGSDLDVGVFFREHLDDPIVPSQLQIEIENIFEPLIAKLTPLEQLDPLSQYDAIEGHRIAAPDPTAANLYELAVISMAEEALWLKRQMESEDSPFSLL